MLQKLHKNAKTNYSIRKEIKESNLSVSALAEKFHISWLTAKKWKERASLEDKSSRPDKIRTTLTEKEEDLILFERKKFKKTVDEIYLTLEKDIPNLYPQKVYRCVRRYGLSSLPEEFVLAERKIRKFRKYTIGYIHIDTLFSPKIAKKRYYIFTAIDRVSKAAYLWIADRKTKEMGARFLRKVLKFYPYAIHYILTDNGFEFSYKALSKGRKTKKVHPFDIICKENKIEHRTIKFKHPWTNGMVERFNGKIKSKVFKRYILADRQDLEIKLTEYLNRYNFEVRLKQIDYMAPADYLKKKFNKSIQPIVC
ncbi:DDE-type integrase/transposase/recombinase [Patescibacteria group bacterium]|nr:DDE-type integrase/transposase/recombinase [Patescibacteria group bacterium]